MIGILLLAIKASQNALAGGLDAVALGGGILSVGVVIGLWIALGLGRGADSCHLTVSGLTLVYRSGRKTMVGWNDPALRFTLYELLSKRGLKHYLATRWRRPFLNPIPQELYITVIT